MNDGPLISKYTVLRRKDCPDIVDLASKLLDRLSIDDIIRDTELSTLQSCIDTAYVDNRRYFVLSMDTDPGAKPALRAYVEFIQYTHPQLATELIEEYDLDEPDYYHCLHCRGRSIISKDAWHIGASSRVWIECQDCEMLYAIERSSLEIYGGQSDA